MFVLSADRGVITLKYQNYDVCMDRTLGLKDSIALSVLMSMLGIVFNLDDEYSVNIPLGTKAGMVCRTYF